MWHLHLHWFFRARQKVDVLTLAEGTSRPWVGKVWGFPIAHTE